MSWIREDDDEARRLCLRDLARIFDVPLWMIDPSARVPWRVRIRGKVRRLRGH